MSTPQQSTAPVRRSAQAYADPALTDTALCIRLTAMADRRDSSVGRPLVWPAPSKPQHLTVPSKITAHEFTSPAVTTAASARAAIAPLAATARAEMIAARLDFILKLTGMRLLRLGLGACSGCRSVSAGPRSLWISRPGPESIGRDPARMRAIAPHMTSPTASEPTRRARHRARWMWAVALSAVAA